jgi:hypothetical protein
VRTLCCRKVAAVKKKGPSPFDRLIVFDFYDGPLEGVATCSVCGSEYVFQVKWWDPHEDLRIFELRPLTRGTFPRIADICPKISEPVSPVWIPIWQFPTEADERQANAAVEELLEPEGTARVLIAAEALDREIAFARNADAEVTYSNLEEWVSWLRMG